jgi:leader peptidase (prepilin peptidase)/N-methyltransferase
LVVASVVLVWLSALTVYDLRWRRLPNWLTLPGLAVILIGAALAGRGVPAALGAAALFTVYAVIHVIAPAAMGAGDVKLAAGLGGLTGAFGPDIWLLAALAAPVFTAVCGFVALTRTRRGGAIPHGPSMCLASAAAVALVVV